MRHLLSIFILILIASSCQNAGSRKAVPVSDIHEVVVDDVLQAGSYTYLHVNERGMEKWLAVPSMIASAGEMYYYVGGLPMENFESKELERSFESVLFLEQVYSQPPEPQAEETVSEMSHTGAVVSEKMDLSVDPAEGGITIAELFADKKAYDGKIVKIRGAVTKFNPAIMDKNWIHLQDGSDFEGNFDLTITSDEEAEPGTVITFEGKITLKRDFGYGYYYEILMEEARILAD